MRIVRGLSIVLALSANLAAGAAAAAAASPSSTRGDPAKIAVAMQILQATHAAANSATMIDMMLPSMMTMVKSSSPGVSDAVLNRFTTTVRGKMTAGIPKLLQLEAGIWSQHFSLAELRQLAAFYRSDLGRRMIEETPKVMKDVMPIGMAWGRATAQQAMEETLGQMRKQGVKI